MFISEILYVRRGKDRVISRVSTLDPNCIVYESIVYEDCRLHVFNAFSSGGWEVCFSRALICDLNVQEGWQGFLGLRIFGDVDAVIPPFHYRKANVRKRAPFT